MVAELCATIFIHNYNFHIFSKRCQVKANALSMQRMYSGVGIFCAPHGVVDDAEKALLGNTRPFYLVLLGTHIVLAATSLPFILWTAYRALTSDFEEHKNLAKKVWPIWFYVAVTGPIVYWMIKQYYN